MGKPPIEPIVFYIDRCLGRKLGQTLQEQGLTIALHDDHFTQNALDVDWLPEVGQRGWVVLTKDARRGAFGVGCKTDLLFNYEPPG